MNIEVSDITIVTLTLGLVVVVALWNRRGVRVRVSPQKVELDLEQPREAITPDLPPRDSREIVAEAGVEPARELPPTGF